jgi:hypothetical protein
VIELWRVRGATSIGDAYGGDTLLLDLVVNWRTFSCAILSWYQHGQTYPSCLES